MRASDPTPDPALNAVLYELVTGAQAVLAENFVAAYLQGSFALGDWDTHSDVDFLIAIAHDVPETDVPALQALHARLYHLDSAWAQHLEGSYVPRDILRRADPLKTPLLFLDNGSHTLVRSAHDNTLVVRWVAREHGIALAGPEPAALIDPVSADDLRQEVRATMRDWAEDIFAQRYQSDNRWAQPFIVLSYCRMLHTLQTGRIGSKPAGARWAASALDRRWTGLIQRAWDERPDPSQKVRQTADPADHAATLAFIRYALTLAGQPDAPSPLPSGTG
jgi:hypothetical protein